MISIERAHYNAWAHRLEASLAHAYPRTVWVVPSHDRVAALLGRVDTPFGFRIIGGRPGSSRRVSVNVPFTLVVDEEVFSLVVVALGRELERRLAALVEEG